METDTSPAFTLLFQSLHNIDKMARGLRSGQVHIKKMDLKRESLKTPSISQ